MKVPDPYDILEYPLSTEKAVRDVEATNTIIFIVKHAATKPQSKWAVQKAFDVRVETVRTAITSKGMKKAFVKLAPDTPALDITTKLGMV